MSKFSENLDHIMDGFGCSNYRLAKLLEVSQTNVCKWRTGVVEPRDDNKEKIAEIFGYDVESLETDNPKRTDGSLEEYEKKQRAKNLPSINKTGKEQNMTELKLKICIECMKDVAEALADISMSLSKEDLANVIGWANGALYGAVSAIRCMEKAEKENAATDVGASIAAG